jgi:hypothetical protein
VLLAGFTGALAWTTSGDVRATIRLADATQEKQRARDRPIVGVRIVEVRNLVLDPTTRQTVPTLGLCVKNVGLGPALDLRLRATYAGAVVPTEEVIAVVEVGESTTQRPISLAGSPNRNADTYWTTSRSRETAPTAPAQGATRSSSSPRAGCPIRFAWLRTRPHRERGSS